MFLSLKNSERFSSMDSALINAYLDGRLDRKKRKELELKIFYNSNLKSLLEKKKDELNYIGSMIPNEKISERSRAQIELEFKQLNEQLLSLNERNILSRIWTWLNRPFYTFKF